MKRIGLELGMALAMLVTGSPSALARTFPVTIDRVIKAVPDTGGAAGVYVVTVHLDQTVPIEPRLLRASVNGKQLLVTTSRYLSENEPYIYYNLESDSITLWLNTKQAQAVAAGMTSVDAFQRQLPLKVLLEANPVAYQPADVTQVLDDQPGQNGVRRLTLKIAHPVFNAGKTAKVRLNGVTIYLHGDAYVGPQGEYALETKTIVLELNPRDPRLAQTGISSGKDLEKLLPLPIQLEK